MRQKTFEIIISQKVEVLLSNEQRKLTGGKMPKRIMEHLMNNTSAGCPPPTTNGGN